MQLLSLLAVGSLAGSAIARSSRSAALAKKNIAAPQPRSVTSKPVHHVKRQAETIIPPSEKTASTSIEPVIGRF